MTGPVGYWHVDDTKESLKLLLDAGAEAQQAISDPDRADPRSARGE